MNKTVLVVEDDKNIRDTFQDILEMEGYEVITAINGKEGLDKLSHGPKPDLVLLDMIMPVMSGQEFLSEVSKKPNLSKIPVIVVSATADKVHTAGAVAFLKKPADIDTLLKLVASHL